MTDIEITEFVESYLNDSSDRVLEISKIDKIYKGILMENGNTTDKLNATYKKYLKDLINECCICKTYWKKIKQNNFLQTLLSLKLIMR